MTCDNGAEVIHGERKVSSTNAVGQIEYSYVKTMNINSYLTLHTQINCTLIIILTVKHKTTKLLEEAKVEKSFLDRIQEA